MMETERIDTAIKFLKEGKSFCVRDLRLSINGTHNIYVTGWSRYLNLENLTKYRALKELEEIKNVFNQMLNASENLRNFICDKEIKYSLGFNYGMGGIGICSERNGVIKWETELVS